jgi:hypothetical protein
VDPPTSGGGAQRAGPSLSGYGRSVDTTHVHAFGQLAATGPLDVGQLIGILLPLLLIQVVLLVVALRDLLRPERRVRGNKLIWAIVIYFGELLGPLLYFAIGREPE